MSVIRIADRYAKSLLDMALEQGVLEEVNTDMRLLAGTVNKSRDFELMLLSPIIKPDKKIAILEKVFVKVVNKVTIAFLRIVVRKGREKFLVQ